MPTQIQYRRRTASSWTSANPTLAAGEFAFESDTNKLKIGDGSTAWTSLPYVVTPLTNYIWSGSITNRNWTITSNTFAEFTSGSGTPSLVEHANINFGSTPTIYSSGISQPGIVFTPPALGTYEIEAISNIRTNSGTYFTHVELGTTAGAVIATNSVQNAVSTTLVAGLGFNLKGFLTVSSLSSVTVRLRAKTVSTAIALSLNSGTNYTRALQFNIHKVA